MMLDSGAEVFLWFGKASSEIEKKLSLKSAQVYVATMKFKYLHGWHFLSLSDSMICFQVYIKYLADQGKTRKFKLAKHGNEPWNFKKCFQGWMD